jgi:hypothetical protein
MNSCNTPMSIIEDLRFDAMPGRFCYAAMISDEPDQSFASARMVIAAESLGLLEPTS